MVCVPVGSGIVKLSSTVLIYDSVEIRNKGALSFQNQHPRDELDRVVLSVTGSDDRDRDDASGVTTGDGGKGRVTSWRYGSRIRLSLR